LLLLLMLLLLLLLLGSSRTVLETAEQLIMNYISARWVFERGWWE
jgi:hypothetical protein